MLAPVYKDHTEFLHDPSDERRAPQLAFCHDAEKLRLTECQNDPERIGGAAVVAAEHGRALCQIFKSLHLQHRVPEKQPHAHQKKAHAIPEFHPSFLLTSSRMAFFASSRFISEVSSFTASGAHRSGATVRVESCLSRAFMSESTFSKVVFSPFA